MPYLTTLAINEMSGVEVGSVGLKMQGFNESQLFFLLLTVFVIINLRHTWVHIQCLNHKSCHTVTILVLSYLSPDLCPTYYFYVLG